METNYNGNSNSSGVYQIRNLNNGRVYIGSAKLFKTRFGHHIKSLEKGTHHNKHLQGAFNLEGTEAFIFEVLEIVEGEQSDRLLVEQKHLDSLMSNWEQCYNFKKETVASSRSCFSKDPKVTKEKRSESAKKLWADEEYRKNQSESGRHTTTECWKSSEHRMKVAESTKKFWSSDEGLEVKQRFAKRMAERIVSNETRNKISKSVSEANKLLWKDPAYRKKVLEGRKNKRNQVAI
jgi:group I intron endonuclease